jgi:hypothetical protein
MNAIDVYDPAQCCATGACSPDADDELAQFAAALEWLKERGVSVSRYNLGHQPGAFVQNATVKGTIEKDGIGSLPLIIADGEILSKGRYPSRAELATHIDLTEKVVPAVASGATKRCCG